MTTNRFELGGVRTFWVMMMAGLLAIAGGCSSGPTGDVSLAVAALSAADVDRVEVTITGAGIDPPIVQELSRAGSQWRGAIGGIPAGTDRTFTVVAYDALGMPIYTGVATGVEVVGDDTVTVVILLQDAVADPPGMESPPEITSVSVIPGVLSPSETASVVVQATDPDPGDTLTYAWTATDGTFADPTLAATTWTAPAADGVYTLTVTVTDSEGSARSVSVDVQVSAANVRGTARIEVTVNTWPDITRFAVNPGLLAPGASGNVLITATDSDGDPLSHTITDDCGGSIAGLVWTAPAMAPVSGECLLTLRTIDGRGGESFATATVYVGDEITGDHAPVIDRTFQSNWEAGSGDVLHFDATASDVDGDALTFTWTATGGTLGVPTDTATTSSNTWTSAGTNTTITVRVSDASGLWDEATFTVRAGWLRGFGTPHGDEASRVASNASRIVVGGVIGDGAGAGEPPIDLGGVSVSGTNDAFVAVYDVGGTLRWARAYENPTGTSRIYGVAIDPSNNVYVTGTFDGTIDLSGESHTSIGFLDVFVIAYDSEGAVRWRRIFASAGADEAGPIAVDASRNRVYVGGLQGGSIDFGGGPSPAFTYSGYLVALDTVTGAWAWERLCQTSAGHSQVVGLTIDTANGDVVAAGAFSGTMDPGLVLTSSSPADGWIVRYAADNTLVWWAAYGGGSNYSYFSNVIVIDGDTYAVANYQSVFRRLPVPGGFVTTSLGSYDAAIIALDALGEERWGLVVRSASSDAAAITAAGDGSLWLASYWSTLDFRIGSTAMPPPVNGHDVFIARIAALDTASPLITHVERLGSSGNEFPTAIAASDPLHPVTVGYYNTPGATAEGIVLSHVGGNDGFVWRHQAASP